MTWDINAKQADESSKIRWELVPYFRGDCLDLGCGPFKVFPHFTGIDSGHHWGTAGADVVVDTAERLPRFANQSHDLVYSSHLLEHIKDFKAALKEWWRVLKVGGHLALYLPHKLYYPNIGQRGANPDHKHDFLPQDIVDAMKEVGSWDQVEQQERNQDNEYSFFVVFKKIS